LQESRKAGLAGEGAAGRDGSGASDGSGESAGTCSGDDHFAVTWTQPDLIEGSTRIFKRRYQRRVIFTDDFEIGDSLYWSFTTPETIAPGERSLRKPATDSERLVAHREGAPGRCQVILIRPLPVSPAGQAPDRVVASRRNAGASRLERRSDSGGRMWNERYAGDEYVFGTEPNSFLAEHARLLEGPVLSLAEGEGRNAVFLASLGLDVHGVDGSSVGLAKAQALARSRNVAIRTELADLAEFVPEANHYGAVVSISAHLPSALRKRLYPLVERSLRPGGLFLLESYSEAQLTRDTGGPKDLDMLMTTAKIRDELPTLEPILLQELVREVAEGRRHTGLAAVVQFIGRKPGD
jgi:SAM-dependent methyltransferase